MTIATHKLRTGKRTARLIVEEHPERVHLRLSLSRYGAGKDFPQILEWISKFAEKYGSDERPVTIDNPLHAQRAMITRDGATVRKLDG